jgi:hypothetical protein
MELMIRRVEKEGYLSSSGYVFEWSRHPDYALRAVVVLVSIT